MDKKQMYNKIMNDVAKIVKKRINESYVDEQEVMCDAYKKDGKYFLKLYLRNIADKTEESFYISGDSMEQVIFNFRVILESCVLSMESDALSGYVVRTNHKEDIKKVVKTDKSLIDEFDSIDEEAYKLNDDMDEAGVKDIYDVIDFIQNYKFKEVSKKPVDFFKQM